MPTSFPASLDTFTNPVAGNKTNAPVHTEQHANANDAIEALEAKVGVTGSAVTASHDYRITQLEAGSKITQLSSDPVSPSVEDVWVLATILAGSGGGELTMLFGAMPITVPNSGGSQTYQLSYRTSEGTTKRVSLT